MTIKFDKLMSLRVRFGYTQADFGKLIGCIGTTYSAKENGDINWFLRECYTLLNVINDNLRKIGEPDVTLTELFPESLLFAKSVSNKKRKDKEKTSA